MVSSGSLAKPDVHLVRWIGGPQSSQFTVSSSSDLKTSISCEVEKKKELLHIFQLSSSSFHELSAKAIYFTKIKVCISPKIVFFKENRKKCEICFIVDMTKRKNKE